MIINKKNIFTNETTIGKEYTLYNEQASLLIVEVLGSASTKEVNISGTTDIHNTDSTKLQTINMSDFTIANDIMKNGIYMIDINGINKISFKIGNVVGGDITVLATVKEA